MSTVKNTTLEIDGMTCGSCVRHIGDALRALAGVAATDVNLREGTAEVRHDPARTTVTNLIETLSAAGYPAREV